MMGLEWVTGANAEWLTITGLTCLVVMCPLLRKTQGVERRLVLGMLILVSGLFFHALYWATANIVKESEQLIDVWGAQFYPALKFILVQTSIAGMAIFCSPILKAWFGPRWWWMVVGVCAASFGAGMWLHLAVS